MPGNTPTLIPDPSAKRGPHGWQWTGNSQSTEEIPQPRPIAASTKRLPSVLLFWHARLAGIEIDAHRDVFLATLGGGLVERDGLDVAKIEPLDRLADIELQDALEPPIGDTDDGGGGGDGHLAHQQQRDPLEQQGEPAVRSGPGNIDAQHAVVGAVGTRDTCRDNVGVPEEIEVPPAQLLPVVRLTEPAAGWAGEAGTRLGGDTEMQFVGLLVDLQALVDHPPARGQPHMR